MKIDIVDTLDVVISAIPRKQLPLFEKCNFRTVHVFVFDRENRLLVQKVGDSNKKSKGMLGSSVAGYLFSGESYIDAAKRRTQQELGVSGVDNFVVIGKVALPEQLGIKFVTLYALRNWSGIVQFDAQHIASIHWLSLDKVANMLKENPGQFTASFIELFDYYKQHAGCDSHPR